MKYLAILGQNPELSLAELTAVYPGAKIISRQNETAIFDSEEKININALGGLPKLAEVLEADAPPKDIKKIIVEELLKLGNDQKIFFGLSFYNSANRGLYNALGKEIKNELKNAGGKARWAVSREITLSSVYIKTNKLLTRGFDFDIVFSPHTLSPSLEGETREGVCIAKTVAVQDFADYEFRDMSRPRRDLVSGMTPPKLAKILINLASPLRRRGGGGDLIMGNFLDPFCGSGTFLMEAALLGYKKICGSDISGRAVNDSAKNLNWLKEKYGLQLETDVKQCDVVDLKKCWNKRFDCIATEPYLGPPIRGKLDFKKAESLRKELNNNYEKYLPALSHALEKNGALVLIVPFLITDKGELKLNLKIKENGLSAVRPSIHYSRPDQKVGREIYILKKTG